MSEAAVYDYVIVGAGSAGCVLASRLSADPNLRVLLLEAGGWDSHPFLRVPLGVGRIWGYERFDWNYSADSGAATGHKRIEALRGKVIGGSHSINAMGYIRGNHGDYDRWANAGLKGWSFSDVLPYFKRTETWEDGETELRGGDGPLYVRRTKETDSLYEAYMAAGISAGHPYTPDYNGAQQHGFGWAQWTIRRGLRETTARAFLRPALKRRNLTVKTRSHALRVVIEKDRAKGVDYVFGGERRWARAEREVILCGGAINTPQLLQLSGIGDPDQLSAFGIKPVLSSKGVGQNLQDHYSTGLAHKRRAPGPFVRATRADRLAVAFARAYVSGTGAATDVPSGFMAFVKTDPAFEIPDIQFLFRSGPANAGPWFPGFRQPWTDAFVCRPVLLRPKSRGRVRLRSANPLDGPVIEQNFLSAPGDIAALRAGFKLLREIAAQKELAPFIDSEIAPGAQTRTDADLDEYIRSKPATAHHLCGTCRMGADPDSVVDDKLRLRGVDALRICDASVMPDLVGGNINAAVIMIAEKAADLVRADARQPAARLLA